MGHASLFKMLFCLGEGLNRCFPTRCALSPHPLRLASEIHSFNLLSVPAQLNFLVPLWRRGRQARRHTNLTDTHGIQEQPHPQLLTRQVPTGHRDMPEGCTHVRARVAPSLVPGCFRGCRWASTQAGPACHPPPQLLCPLPCAFLKGSQKSNRRPRDSGGPAPHCRADLPG